MPAAGLFVVAHRMSAARQGPFDSLRSGANGQFRFTIARPDSGAVYLVSARYAGIGYVSEPFAGNAREGADAIVLPLFDTASAGPPLTIGNRHIVITSPDAPGARRILDIVMIRNTGSATRVGPDSMAAVWRMRLPEAATAVQAGESEVPLSAMRFEGGEVLVTAPIAPGEKQIAVTYLIPDDAARLTIPVDQPTASFAVLAEDSLTRPLAGLERADPMLIEGRVFQRFTATSLAAGAAPAVALRRTGSRQSARSLWWMPVAAVGLLLVVGAVYAVRVAPGSGR